MSRLSVLLFGVYVTSKMLAVSPELVMHVVKDDVLRRRSALARLDMASSAPPSMRHDGNDGRMAVVVMLKMESGV